MGICSRCGGPIEFAYIDGRCTPIHLNGSCSRGASSLRLEAGLRRDFCRPTNCPKCGDEVFFVRYNGGSVWFDELGWPWPKHPCFGSILPKFPETVDASKPPLLGIVLSISVASRRIENRMIVRLETGKEIGYFVKYPYPSISMVGNLVTVSSPHFSLIYPTDLKKHIERCFYVTPEVPKPASANPLPAIAKSVTQANPPIPPKLMRKCEYCSTPLSEIEDMGAHLRDHPDWKCQHCSFVTLSHESFCHHLIDCHRQSL